MTTELIINTDVLTFDDLIFLDELKLDDLNNVRPRSLKEFLARFVIVDGVHLLTDDAIKALGKMTVTELSNSLQSFKRKIKELQVAAVSPTITSG